MRPGVSNGSNSPRKKTINLNRLFVIIPAIGLGTKVDVDNNRVFIDVDGVSVIERTLNAFKVFGEELSKAGTTLRAVIVTDEAYVYKINGICRYRKYTFVQNVVSGGQTRMESVWKGIEAMSELPFPPTDDDVVFIHDGNRCLIDEETLERCIEGALQHEIVAAAVSANKTISQSQAKPESTTVEVPEKPVEEPKKSALGLDLSKFPSLAGRLGKTGIPPIAQSKPEVAAPAFEPKPIFKSNVVTPAPETKAAPVDDNNPKDIQTPQVFRYGKLLKVYVNGIKRNLDVENDTELAAALNLKVHIVEGSSDNIKVKTLEDVTKAEAILKRQAAEQKDS